MPFDVFHEAVEKSLGRPVYTHEFAHPELLMEGLIGQRKAPTFQDIVNLIPVAWQSNSEAYDDVLERENMEIIEEQGG